MRLGRRSGSHECRIPGVTFFLHACRQPGV